MVDWHAGYPPKDVGFVLEPAAIYPQGGIGSRHSTQKLSSGPELKRVSLE